MDLVYFKTGELYNGMYQECRIQDVVTVEYDSRTKMLPFVTSNGKTGCIDIDGILYLPAKTSSEGFTTSTHFSHRIFHWFFEDMHHEDNRGGVSINFLSVIDDCWSRVTSNAECKKIISINTFGMNPHAHEFVASWKGMVVVRANYFTQMMSGVYNSIDEDLEVGYLSFVIYDGWYNRRSHSISACVETQGDSA